MDTQDTIFPNSIPEQPVPNQPLPIPSFTSAPSLNLSPESPHIQRLPLASPVTSSPVSPKPFSSVPPLPEDEKKNGFQIPQIAKILIGILLILVIGFVLFIFILPMFNKPKTITLTYWGLWEDANIMQPLINDFQRQYPNIKISYSKEDPKQYVDKIFARVNNGLGPDIFRFHNTWVPMFSSVLLPLSKDVITPSDFQKNFYPVASGDLIRKGAIYGIPLEMDTLELFINKDLFTSANGKVPVTWNDFVETARSLTVKDTDGNIKISGAALGSYDNITHAPDILSLLFIQNGASLQNFANTTQNASDALNFYTSFAKDTNATWSTNSDSSLKDFAKGNLAMYFGYSWDVLTIKALNPNLSFDIVPVPSLLGRKTTIASYWVEGVSSKSTHQKEALLFMHYLAQKETEEKFFTETSKTRTFGEPYARRDLADKLKENSLVYPFIKNATDAVSSFFAGDTGPTGINAAMNGYLGNAVRSVLINTSAQSAIDTLSAGVAQKLQQYGQ